MPDHDLLALRYPSGFPDARVAGGPEAAQGWLYGKAMPLRDVLDHQLK